MKTLRISLTALMLIAGLALLGGPVRVAALPAANTIEVSQRAYLTANGEYDRNPSIIHDGTDYWLFWTKGDNTSTAGVRGTGYDPDDDTYVVYYKKAATIASLAGATDTKLALSDPGPPYDFDQRVVTAVVANDGTQDCIYAIVSSGFSASHRSHGMYYYKYDGSTWSGPVTMIAPDSANQYGAHVNAVSDGSTIYIVWDSGVSKFFTYDPSTDTLTGPTQISTDNMPKITLMGSTLYVVSIEDGSGDIEVYSSATSPVSWSSHSTAIAGGGMYDPCIFNDGTNLYVVSAPWVATDRQYLVQTKYSGTAWATPKTVSYGGYGTTEWWDYWPIGYHDGTDAYVFFTTETDSPTYSDGEIAYVKMDWDLSHDHYFYIQNAVDQASDGDTVNVAAGTYAETVNVEGFAGLTINGADKTSVTVQPWSTLCWNVGPYGCSRKAVFRVVDSTDVVLQNMTMDFDKIKANFVHGILYWDSTGTVDNNILKNMSVSDVAGGYYEIGSYYRAPGYTDASRADIAISDNTFIDTGRLGVCTHQYVNATITGNTFYKTTDDFGYAIEMGSESTGSIKENTVYGYDTSAASDGSNSAGIYIENAFTGSTSGLTKNVLVENNEVHNCQWALYVGNEFDGFTGDVDISVTLNDNDFHDNVDGGAAITDEDKENGSSVSLSGGGNSLKNNGGYGYYIYTQGDGDITVNLTEEIITGHDKGVYVEDTGSPSSSSYSVAVRQSNISGNSTAGMDNAVSSLTIDASSNWWGTDTPTSVAAAVSANVDYTPWLDSGTDTSGAPGFQGDFSALHVDDDSPQTGSAGRIQEGVDMVSGSTVYVAAGTYQEQVEIITDLTLVGAGSGTVVQSPDVLTKYYTTSGDNYPVIYVHDTDDVTIQDLVVDGAGKGNANYRFVGIGYHNAGGTVDSVDITDVRDTPWSGAQHGVAMYAFNEDGTARTLTVSDCNIHDFQKNGMALLGDNLTVDVYGNTVTGYGPTNVTAQNGIQVGYGATGIVGPNNNVSDVSWLGPTWTASGILILYGDVDITDNTVSNGQTGIYVWEGSSNISGNDISASVDGTGTDSYWGIIAADPPGALPRPFDGSSEVEAQSLSVTSLGTTSLAATSTRATVNVEHNTLTGGDDSENSEGLEADAGYGTDNLAFTATCNDITGWGYGVFIYQCQEDCTGTTFDSIQVHDNNIFNNIVGMYANVASNATYNWWGDASGPSHSTNPDGKGDSVTDNVDFKPWLKSEATCAPTAITLASFTAKAGVGSVALAWETGTEVDNAGFNLYRATAESGPYAKINGALIAAEGDPVSGAGYSFLDKGLSPGTYYYKLEDVDLTGTTTLHGPVSAAVLPRLRRPTYRPTLP
jgi:hypothetical protein